MDLQAFMEEEDEENIIEVEAVEVVEEEEEPTSPTTKKESIIPHNQEVGAAIDIN